MGFGIEDYDIYIGSTKIESVYFGDIEILHNKNYNITYNLNKVASSNNITSIKENTSYYAKITPIEGYEINSTVITMGGIDITSIVFNNNEINISKVTGDLIISITASEILTISNISNITQPAQTEFYIEYNTNISVAKHEVSWDGGNVFYDKTSDVTSNGTSYRFKHDSSGDAGVYNMAIRVTTVGGSTKTSNIFTVTLVDNNNQLTFTQYKRLDGGIITDTTDGTYYSTTEKYEVTPGTSYTFTLNASNYICICYYDSNGVYKDYASKQTDNNTVSNFTATFAIPLGVKYIQICATGNASTPMTCTFSNNLLYTDNSYIIDDFSTYYINNSLWKNELGHIRNNELQRYSTNNTEIKDGVLELQGKKDSEGTWTSASIITHGAFSFLYGKIEARMKVSTENGSFPAFWTMGDGFEYEYNEWGDHPCLGDYWAWCGEFDIMEYNYKEFTTGVFFNEKDQAGRIRTSNYDINEWHTFGMDWGTEGDLKFYYDGQLVTQTPATDNKAFHTPHYVMFDQAIGAAGGTPDSDCTSMTSYVDWVRYYPHSYDNLKLYAEDFDLYLVKDPSSKWCIRVTWNDNCINKAMSWSSSNTEALEVHSGYLNVKYQYGEATITCSSRSGVHKDITIYINNYELSTEKPNVLIDPTISQIANITQPEKSEFYIEYSTNVAVTKHEVSWDGGNTFYDKTSDVTSNGTSYKFKHDNSGAAGTYRMVIRVTTAAGKSTTSNIFTVTLNKSGTSSLLDSTGAYVIDDFSGSSVNSNKWGYELGYVRNNETQKYTNTNAEINNGILALRGKKASDGSWTSASIISKGHFAFMYGKIVARVRACNYNGAFGAFWTLGDSFEFGYKENSNPDTLGEWWAYCGEFDVMEFYNGKLTCGTFFNEKEESGRVWYNNYPTGDWHEFAMQWNTDGSLIFSIDGNELSRTNATNNRAFHIPHFILLNQAIGASGGTPDSSTTEITQYVDWVKYYPLSTDNLVENSSDFYLEATDPNDSAHNCVVRPKFNDNCINKSITWQSSNPSLVTCHSGLCASYSGANGEVVITGTSHSGVSKQITLTVTNGVLREKGSGGSDSSDTEYATSCTSDYILDKIYPMPQNHEALPNGVTDTWGTQSRWENQLRPTATAHNCGQANCPGAVQFRALGAWSNIYRVKDSGFSSNTGVEMRNIKVYGWYNGQWEKVQDMTVPDGNFYAESFSGDSNQYFSDSIKTTSTSKTIILREANKINNENCMYHPFSNIKNFDVKYEYVYTCIDLRKVKWDESGVDDRDSSHYCANCGGDWWLAEGLTFDSSWQHNKGICQPKMIEITNNWRRFSMTNVPQGWTNGFPQ